MDILIRAKLKPVEAGDFHYGNIPSAYGVNTRYFTKNNEPYTVIAGELHFSRCPRARWKSTLLKMRDCGINTVSTMCSGITTRRKRAFSTFPATGM